MKRSARGWITLTLLATMFSAASCSSSKSTESAAQVAPEPASQEALEAPQEPVVILSGVEAVEAAGLGKMWTFDKVPLDYLEERYDFTPTDEWFEHVRLASLRYGGGCSASFISPNGLVMTNHHCARGCIAAVSSEEKDYDTDGFYAGSQDGELTCPGLFLDQLVGIEEVTARIDAAVPAGATDEEATEAKESEAGRIDEECEAGSDLRCQVVSLYNGGIYSLYKYKRYTDVRLVFAPEGQAAFFGGDPDNFTYPRHDLDITLVRAYEDGQPVQPEHYFEWSESGADEGELVFVTGNPGSTGRLLTMAQLEYLRDAAYPTMLQQYDERVSVARLLSEQSPELEMRYRNLVFGIENSIKAVTGYHGGLEDPTLMKRKKTWEKSFRAAVAADSRLQQEYGGAWDEIARVNKELIAIDAERRFTSFSNFRLLTTARDIVRLTADMAKPEAEREYNEEQVAAIQRRINSTRPIDVEYEKRLLALRLASALDALGPDDPFIKAALQGRDPDAAAKAMYSDTQLTNVEMRTALVEGGAAAVAASEDPAIILARTVDARARELSQRAEELGAIESVNEEKVAEALFHVYGTALPPDATFTLRLSDGVVARYPLNGTYAPYKTTFYGLFDRAASFDHKDPWFVAPKWKAAKDKLDLSTPLNFVCTADIIGGNSGSPVINQNAEVVGLVFDGNIEMLPNRFLYTDEVSRTVSVHSDAIIEALRKIYNAGELADEIEGKR